MNLGSILDQKASIFQLHAIHSQKIDKTTRKQEHTDEESETLQLS